MNIYRFFKHNIKGDIMKKPGCSKCQESQIQGRCYIDDETGLLCVTLEKKIDLPKGKKILVPQICTVCGTTEWITIDTEN